MHPKDSMRVTAQSLNPVAIIILRSIWVTRMNMIEPIRERAALCDHGDCVSIRLLCNDR